MIYDGESIYSSQYLSYFPSIDVSSLAEDYILLTDTSSYIITTTTEHGGYPTTIYIDDTSELYYEMTPSFNGFLIASSLATTITSSLVPSSVNSQPTSIHSLYNDMSSLFSTPSLSSTTSKDRIGKLKL